MKDSCFNRIGPIQIWPETTSLFKDQPIIHLHKVKKIQWQVSISPKKIAELYLLMPFVYSIDCQAAGLSEDFCSEVVL